MLDGVLESEVGWKQANLLVGSYILFTHMMAQRRKVMRGKQAEKKL